VLNLRMTSGDLGEPAVVSDAPPAPARLKQVRREMLADFCKMLVAEARLRPWIGDGSTETNGNGKRQSSLTGYVERDGNGIRGRNSRVVLDDRCASPEPGAGQPVSISIAAVNDAPHLSRRLRQTLDRLLAGDAEKQIARHLGLSRHTVHVYIKALYRCFGVNSRGELLARFVAHAAG
jgi:DNA-binding CsgD family transcriptional regulator